MVNKLTCKNLQVWGKRKKSPIVLLSLKLKKYYTCDRFAYGGLKLWGLKIAILADLRQLTRDIFRAINE